MVTSAAVPAVVGTAMIGTQGFLVGATPSRLLTSANSGLLMIIPMAFAVSIGEPPPMAMIKSAPDFLYSSTPFCTFSMVGFSLILVYTS